jgi:uncharacterized DUF497 family protein
METEHDPEKERINREKHGIGFAGARAVFENYRIDAEDHREDYGEARYVTLRLIGQQVVVCSGLRSATRRGSSA